MRLGPYEILGNIARGGMGAVLRGRAPDGRAVAIKVLARPNDPAALARFERELRLLALFGEREGFVPLLEAGESSNGPWIAMPFIEGGTLRDRLDQGPLPPEEALGLARRLAAAMARAHEKGIVHRDLKPENILFARDGRPLIADLGLAKHFDREALGASRSVSLSRTGELRGTAGYMPLEQAHDARSAGPAADVFALGAILHECIAGEPAFPGESLIEVLTRLDEGKVPPLEAAPPWVASLVARCLARAPEDRPRDATELLRLLEAGPKRRRAPIALVGAGLGAALAGAAALAVVVVLRRPPPATPASTFPRVCSGFLETPRTRLATVLGSYARRHGRPVNRIALTPDGQILSASADESVKIWSLDAPEEVASLERQNGSIFGLAVVKGGREVVTASADESVRVFDLATRRRMKLIDATASLDGLAMTPDGPIGVAVGSRSELIAINIEAGTAQPRQGVRPRSRCVAISDDGSHIIAGTQDGTVVSMASRAREREIPVSRRPISSVSFLDASRALAGSEDGSVRVVDLERGATVAELGDPRVRSVTAAAAGPRDVIAAGTDDGDVWLWDLPTRSTSVRTPRQGGPIRSIAFAPDGRFATGSDDGTVRMFDASGNEVAPLRGPRGRLHALARVGDERLLTGGLDGNLRFWDATSGGEVVLDDRRDEIHAIALGAEASVAVTVGARGIASFHDLRAKRPGTARVTGLETLRAATFVRGSALLACAGDAGRIELLDPRPPHAPVATLEDHRGPVLALLAVPGRDELLSAGDDRTIRLWDLGTQRVIRRFEGHGFAVRALALTPDGRRLVSGGLDRKLRVHDLADGRLVKTLDGHEGEIFAIAVGEKLAVTASWDETIRLWDLEAGRELDKVSLASATDFGEALSLAPDGRSFWVATSRGVLLEFEVR